MVDAAKPGDILWDAEVRGFGLRVTTGGSKSYIFQFRALTGEQGKITFGHVGSMTVEEARSQASEYRYIVDKGGNPSRDKREEREADTMSQLAVYYCTGYAKSAGLRPRTVHDAKHLLDHHMAPQLGKRKVKAVVISDIRHLHGITRDKVGNCQANKLLAVLSKMFALAIEQGLRPDNPCKGIKKFPEDVRKVYFTEEDLPKLLSACDRYPDQSASNAIRMLLFTGARLNEVLKADWSQINLERGIWTKPSSHTKTKQLHVLHLPEAVLIMLRKMRTENPNEIYLFPGTIPGKPRYDIKKPWAAILKNAGLSGFRRHDMRRTMASFLIEDTSDYAKAGKVLGHTQVSTTARYAQAIDRGQKATINKAIEHMKAGYRPEP